MSTNRSDISFQAYQRGEDFQNEIKSSLSKVPGTWTMPIQDGRGGSKPADRLILFPQVSILAELKRTKKKAFKFDFLEPNQVKGLADFHNPDLRRYGIVFCSFLDEAKELDEAYAFSLENAAKYMRRYNTMQVPIFDMHEIQALKLERIDDYYDLQEVAECYKYL
jgi:hypothetical protein